MKFNPYSLFFLLLLSVEFSTAQFTLDGEFRPRTEYRHGYGTIIADSADAGYAISNRLRLNAGYNVDAYKFYVSLQDVMVWGENRQLRPEDANNSFSIFEAWADIRLGQNFSTKLGRQTIDLDDQRIMGSVGWAQQGRNHDAALLKYAKNDLQIDLALAYNQDFNDPSGFQSVGNTYYTTGFFSYKTMEYLYLKKSLEKFNGSLLLLNNGFQDFKSDGTTSDGQSYLQTIGTHLEYMQNDFGSTANAFIQTGQQQGNLKVNGAFLLGFDLSYKAFENIGFMAGTEVLSGNGPGTTGRTHAFFPLYGTNHKFNGFMDYFYVGNHANSIGLVDVHVGANMKLAEASNLLIKVLNFHGQQRLPSGDKSLGTEVDLVFTQNFKGFNLQLGYSQLFATDGMYELKGTTEEFAANSQNWAWAMLTLKPKFLNTAKEE